MISCSTRSALGWSSLEGSSEFCISQSGHVSQAKGSWPGQLTDRTRGAYASSGCFWWWSCWSCWWSLSPWAGAWGIHNEDPDDTQRLLPKIVMLMLMLRMFTMTDILSRQALCVLKMHGYIGLYILSFSFFLATGGRSPRASWHSIDRRTQWGSRLWNGNALPPSSLLSCTLVFGSVVLQCIAGTTFGKHLSR